MLNSVVEKSFSTQVNTYSTGYEFMAYAILSVFYQGWSKKINPCIFAFFDVVYSNPNINGQFKSNYLK